MGGALSGSSEWRWMAGSNDDGIDGGDEIAIKKY